jgi:hypothetical protein
VVEPPVRAAQLTPQLEAEEEPNPPEVQALRVLEEGRLSQVLLDLWEQEELEVKAAIVAPVVVAVVVATTAVAVPVGTTALVQVAVAAEAGMLSQALRQ